MSTQRDSSPYEVLAVPPGASPSEIESAYRRIKAEMAPGSLSMYAMFDAEEGARILAQVEAAYRTLADPQSRAALDRLRLGPQQAPDAAGTASAAAPPAHVRRRRHGGRLRPGEGAAEDSAQPWLQRGAPAAVGAHLHSAPGAASGPDATRHATPVPASHPAHSASPARGAGAGPQPPPLRAAQRQAAARGRLALPLDVVQALDSDTEYSGPTLRRLRETAGIELEAIADLTRVARRYLTAIEGQDFELLPAPVYVRGFVTEYARVLGLDAKAVALSYMALYRRLKNEGG